MAPVGVQTIFNEQREVGLAKACAEINVPYIMSTASSSTIEEVAAANGPDGQRWFQLYWPQDHNLTKSILKRAKAGGFKTLVVTLDTWALAWRPADLDEAYVPFMKGVGNSVGFSDPVFREQFAARSGGKKPEEDPIVASQQWIGGIFAGKSHSWEDLKLLREEWDGPIVLKGVQDVEDARLAVEHGMDGIVVSNHGGRQLDGAIASLEVLPEIVDAVGDKLTVLFDSGIRTGVDIIKALSLGAKAVLVGRPAVYGFAVGGREGAKQVLRGLLADLDQSMGIAGINGIEGCTRKILRKVSYGGDLRSNN
jgi:isopentenyl diphosphate isomerase/L-lactate dehydrogenase-like FMN-dependent dehydrogenase